MRNSLTVAVQGAQYLAKLVDRRGKFLYRSDVGHPGAATGYNLLRHCGTIWAMAQIANQTGALPEVRQAAQRATEWLIEEKIRPYRATGTACLVAGDTVKLGGNGLAILALLEMAGATGRADYITIATRLAEYVLSQQRPDGDFVHKRRFSTGEILPFQSDYYVGEALFGLLRLAAVTGDHSWLDVAAASERQLAARDYGVSEQSHWMLYALEQLHALQPRAEYRAHARAIAVDIVKSPMYRLAGRAAPIACRSEGLLAFVRLCDGVAEASPDHAVMTRLATSALDAIRQNLELQVVCRRPDGSFVRGDRHREVRIDYVQHNISSFFGYSQLSQGSRSVSTDGVT